MQALNQKTIEFRERERLRHKAAREKAKEERSTTDCWIGDWRRLNSEDEAVVAMAKRTVRHRMDVLVSINRKERDRITKATTDGEEITPKEKAESFGLADEY